MNTNKINWNTVAVVSIIVLLILLVGGNLLGGWGMMGLGMMGGWGFSPFGWIAMLFMWLIPMGFIVLTVLGVIWIVRALGGGTNPTSHSCPSCGHGVQTDWHNCPYCGAALAK